MNAVTKAGRQEIAPVTPDPMHMLQSAIERGMSGEDLSKMMDLADRWEANQARKAYVRAMNAFKENPPVITKNKHVSFTTGRGTTEYDHATHDQVCEIIGKALSERGLTHRWSVDQDGERIKVTCILTHVDGHSESVSMQSGSDDSGGKNRIQAIASAVTYLQRYTLQAITGLGAKDRPDDDGAGAEIELVTPAQAADLRALAQEVGADMPKFLDYIGAASFEEIPAAKHKRAIAALNARRNAK